IALPGAIIQIAAATGLGMGVGLLWGWPWGAGCDRQIAGSAGNCAGVAPAAFDRAAGIGGAGADWRVLIHPCGARAEPGIALGGSAEFGSRRGHTFHQPQPGGFLSGFEAEPGKRQPSAKIKLAI